MTSLESPMEIRLATIAKLQEMTKNANNLQEQMLLDDYQVTHQDNIRSATTDLAFLVPAFIIMASVATYFFNLALEDGPLNQVAGETASALIASAITFFYAKELIDTSFEVKEAQRGISSIRDVRRQLIQERK